MNRVSGGRPSNYSGSHFEIHCSRQHAAGRGGISCPSFFAPRSWHRAQSKKARRSDRSNPTPDSRGRHPPKTAECAATLAPAPPTRAPTHPTPQEAKQAPINPEAALRPRGELTLAQRGRDGQPCTQGLLGAAAAAHWAQIHTQAGDRWPNSPMMQGPGPPARRRARRGLMWGARKRQKCGETGGRIT